MSKRTDVHSPSNLRTEDYEFAFCYDAKPEYPEDARWRIEQLNRLLSEGYRFGQVHGGDVCDHCGTPIRYIAVMKHLPTKTLIKIGETCLGNRFELASEQFHALRKAASLNRDRMKKADKRADFLAVERNAEAVQYAREREQEFVDAFYAKHGYPPARGCDEGWGMFFVDMVYKLDRDGALSEAQVDALLASKAKHAERQAQRAKERESAAPVVEGKIVVTGEVVKIDISENAYGVREVMTVKDDRGFKVWGTQPRSLYEAKVGDRVTFTATVEKSDRDETFGFFKRPTKAAIL